MCWGCPYKCGSFFNLFGYKAGFRDARLIVSHHSAALLTHPYRPGASSPPRVVQRMSGSELTSLMKDVGGSDMAIQFDEFAEVRIGS